MEPGNYVLMLVDPSNFLALMVTLLFSIGYLLGTLKNMSDICSQNIMNLFHLYVASK